MSVRMRFHLLHFVAFPGGSFALGLQAMQGQVALLPVMVLYAALISLLGRQVRCPSCHERVGRLTVTIFGHQMRMQSAYIRKQCDTCGQDLSRPTWWPRPTETAGKGGNGPPLRAAVTAVRGLTDRSWTPPIAQAIQRAKARGELVFLLTLLLVAGVVASGIRLWPALPGQVPTRGFHLTAFLLSPTQLPRVPKTVISVFGEVALGLGLLPLYWALLRASLPSRTLRWLRSRSIQLRGEFLEALEASLTNEFCVWFVCWVALRLSLDAQKLWYLALWQRSDLTSAALRVIGPVAAFGFVLSLAATWYRLRAAAAA